MTAPQPHRDTVTAPGLAFAFSAYVLWGVLPLAFVALAPAGPVEVVSWRVVLAVVFCAVLLTVTRGWRRFVALVRDRRTLGLLTIAAVLILVNWSVYIYSALDGHVVEASLGYFINPLVTVILGVVVLSERLRPLQWIAVGISAVAVLVLVVAYGSFPWIAIVLALSFGLYGFVKRGVGPRADAIGGLAVETLVLSPLAAGALAIVALTGGLVMGTQGPWHTALMLSLGAITAIPLILFAAAARRLPLVTMGFMQYLAPIMQFAIGVWVLHEDMPPERWIGFGLVWLALVLLMADMVRNRRRIDASSPEDDRKETPPDEVF